ncbi:MAG: hypothetical protein US42_C0008G0035 [Candidatus Magasanikbacteria bacterium GW2011_GWC2_37_14]|uniref:Lipoprotein signal peptidase n=1 Tax=Candidatus Magasanikbacteria bacterium GW2011_GWC2_37_14 TaxID=1619046 RepID=A0A0G0ITM0_9BACT|nr:MAG: hypothetical protein US42_C0008G0035 [Candidatus Magasanikbacteria bacterium GW2011_GWC2_37_14]
MTSLPYKGRARVGFRETPFSPPPHRGRKRNIMNNKARLTMYILTSGLFLLLDQLLKYLARTNPDYTYYLWRPWLGWEYFGNTGIAFSLPIPNWLIIIITPLIFLGLFLWFVSLRGSAHWRSRSNPKEVGDCFATLRSARNDRLTLAICLITAGALSNYLDRILFGVTIDYLRFFTGIINLADVMIVGGVTLLLFNNKRNF